MFKKNLVSFEPTTFSQKLTLYLPKTNFQSNQFFFELATTFFQPTCVRRNCWQMTNYMKIVVYTVMALQKRGLVQET